MRENQYFQINITITFTHQFLSENKITKLWGVPHVACKENNYQKGNSKRGPEWKNAAIEVKIKKEEIKRKVLPFHTLSTRLHQFPFPSQPKWKNATKEKNSPHQMQKTK